jgi:hypothetical protein
MSQTGWFSSGVSNRTQIPNAVVFIASHLQSGDQDVEVMGLVDGYGTQYGGAMNSWSTARGRTYIGGKL